MTQSDMMKWFISALMQVRLSSGAAHDEKNDKTLANALSLGMGHELPHRSGLNMRLPRTGE